MKKLIIVLLLCISFLTACHSQTKSEEAISLSSEVKDSTLIEQGEEIPLASITKDSKKNLFILWQPNCGPCEAEYEILNSLIPELEEMGIQVISVGYGDEEELKSAIEEWPVTGRIVEGTENFLEALSPEITSTPAMFMCNERGEPIGTARRGYNKENREELKVKILELE